MPIPRCASQMGTVQQWQCEVCSSCALLSPIQGWWLLSPHWCPKPVGPRSCLQPQATSCLCASEKWCARVPGSSGNRAVTSQGEHPQRAKEGFWAAAKLIPALISTKINPKLYDRSKEAHQRLKPPITEIPVHLHTAAPSLWTRACPAWDTFGPGLVEFVLNPPPDELSLQFQQRSSVAQHSLADDEGHRATLETQTGTGRESFWLPKDSTHVQSQNV